MSEIMMQKAGHGTLAPMDEEGMELIRKIKPGQPVRVKITQPRNAQFHRKFFALLKTGYEYWEPPKQEWQGHEAVKNFDVYREQVTILAGYREVTYNLDGSVKVVAKSISFTKMSEAEFQHLYRAVYDVIWNKVMKHIQGFTPEAMDNAINGMMSYG